MDEFTILSEHDLDRFLVYLREKLRKMLDEEGAVLIDLGNFKMEWT